MASGLPLLSATNQEYAHILCVGLLEFDRLPMDAQAVLSDDLRKRISEIAAVREARKKKTLIEQHFDSSLCLIFLTDPSIPVQIAMELAQVYAARSQAPLRMGLHSGTIFRSEGEATSAEKVIGDGPHMARKIMECGESGHILVSADMASRLGKGIWANYWGQYLTEIGAYSNDYGIEIPLFNLVANNIGNATPPRKVTGKLTEQVMAHILFMDVAGSSKFQGEAQLRMYRELQDIVRSTTAYQRALKTDEVICRPLGDGMLVVFFGEMMAPIQCAIEIAKTVKQYEFYMGVHSGMVSRVTDINGNPDVSGNEVILARRVQESCDTGHILVSDYVGRTLSRTAPWSQWLRYLGTAYDKHKNPVEVYNLVTPEVGNKTIPSKMRQGSGKLSSSAVPMPDFAGQPAAPSSGSPYPLGSSPSGQLPNLSNIAQQEAVVRNVSPLKPVSAPRRSRFPIIFTVLILTGILAVSAYLAFGQDLPPTLQKVKTTFLSIFSRPSNEKQKEGTGDNKKLVDEGVGTGSLQMNVCLGNGKAKGQLRLRVELPVGMAGGVADTKGPRDIFLVENDTNKELATFRNTKPGTNPSKDFFHSGDSLEITVKVGDVPVAIGLPLSLHGTKVIKVNYDYTPVPYQGGDKPKPPIPPPPPPPVEPDSEYPILAPNPKEKPGVVERLLIIPKDGKGKRRIVLTYDEAENSDENGEVEGFHDITLGEGESRKIKIPLKTKATSMNLHLNVENYLDGKHQPEDYELTLHLDSDERDAPQVFREKPDTQQPPTLPTNTEDGKASTGEPDNKPVN